MLLSEAADILPFWRFVEENTSMKRLLYGVRVTCHRFSSRGLVTAQQRQLDDALFSVTSYLSSAPTSRRGEKR